MNNITASEDAIAILSAFDYDTLDLETRTLIHEKTGRIKERIRRTAQVILDIGEDLIAVKDRLENRLEVLEPTMQKNTPGDDLGCLGMLLFYSTVLSVPYADWVSATAKG